MAEIVDFDTCHLPSAAAMAYDIWGDEVPDMPGKMRRMIYEYLVRYYFDETSDLNLALCDNGELKAYLLASTVLHEPCNANRFLLQNITGEFQIWAKCYQAYLEGNRRLENSFKRNDEAVLLFFVSKAPGSGKLLMQEFQRRAVEQKLKTMLLWTDNTCNYQYYFDRDFELLDRRKSEPGLPGMALETMIFRKPLT